MPALQVQLEAPMHRLGRVTKLCRELSEAGLEPPGFQWESCEATSERESRFGNVSGRLLVYIFGFVDGMGAVCSRWQLASIAPGLWRERCERAAQQVESVSLRRAESASRSELRRYKSALEAAGRALASSPATAYAELRDSLAAAARGAGPPSSAETAAILDAAAIALGRPSGCAKRRRQALEGEGGLLRLPVALRKLDVSKLYVDKPEVLARLCAAVRRPSFPAPSEPRSLLVARLCAWCVAAASLGERLEARHQGSVEVLTTVAERAERATSEWIAACKPTCRRTPSTENGSSRRKKCASAPPASPTLYDIYVDAKRQPTPTSQVQQCAAMLRRFYEKHNPALAQRAEAIAEEWRGSETTLFALLRYKYAGGSQPDIPTTKSTTRHRRMRRASLPPPKQPPVEHRQIGELRREIDRLKCTVDRAQTEATQAKTRARAAVADAKRARDLLSQLQHVDAATPAQEAPHSDDCRPQDADDVALDAVMSAVIDVLLTESAIEIDFELEYAGGRQEDSSATGRRVILPVSPPSSPTQQPRPVSPARVMPLLPIDGLDEASAPLPPIGPPLRSLQANPPPLPQPTFSLIP